MAAHYLDEIRAFQPQGPYLIAGFCFGGLVAYEMAQQLVAAGEEVGFLALLDTNAAGRRLAAPDVDAWRTQLRRRGERVVHYLGDLWLLKAEEMLPYLRLKTGNVKRKLLLKLKARLEETVVTSYPRSSGWMPTSLQALQEEENLTVSPYQPRPYPGPIHLYRSSMQGAGYDPDPDMGWGNLANVERHVVPGYRETLLETPRVRILAQALQAHLIEAQKRLMATSAR